MRALPIVLMLLTISLTQFATTQTTSTTPNQPTATPAAVNAEATTGTTQTLASRLWEDSTETFTLNLEKLLADPLREHPELRWLQERRAWAARQTDQPGAAIKVAGEFEERSAHYPALEMLWLAEKLTLDEAVRAELNTRMRGIQQKMQKEHADVDAAVQMWGAGKPLEAIEQLNTIVKSHPFNELAYYQTGYLYLQSYRSEAAKHDKLIVPSMRARLFRLCYEKFACTMVIDPFYEKAYEQLNIIREILSDQPEFLQLTNVLSQVSLDFRTVASPAIARLDEGQRTPEALQAAGDGMLKVNQPAYAALLFRAALIQPKLDAKLASEISEALQKALDRLPKDPGTQPAVGADATPAPAVGL